MFLFCFHCCYVVVVVVHSLMLLLFLSSNSVCFLFQISESCLLPCWAPPTSSSHSASQVRGCSSYHFLSKPQLNHNSTQPNITLCWVRHENDFAYTRPPTTETQCLQYHSCYWHDFDENLKVASLERLEQIPTVTVTFFQATFVLLTFVHIRNISTVIDLILMKL